MGLVFLMNLPPNPRCNSLIGCFVNEDNGSCEPVDFAIVGEERFC